MNKEQVKSLLRTLVATFGGVLAGYFAAKGYASTDQIMSVLTSETFLSLSASVIVGVWGIVNKTRNNIVASAAQLPEVTRIEVTDRKLAADVNPTVDATVTTVPANGR